MNALVVGGGAREHSIIYAIEKSTYDVKLYAAMGNRNPGIARACEDFLICDVTNVDKISHYASGKKIDLAIIGPEAPLNAGVTDSLEKLGIRVASPTRAAAQIECDKSFCRNLLKKHGISGSPEFGVFSDLGEASDFIDSVVSDIVVKPIGLTGGKGVKIVGEQLKDAGDAKKYVLEVIESKIGGSAMVVLEERLEGEECTIQAFTDGKTLVPMPLVQDHKRAYEGDTGPNTGGMGSYSDCDLLLPFIEKGEYEACIKIMSDTIKAIKEETGNPYKGILYGQFILTERGPYLIEYNCRFGDPEAMNVLPLLKTDFMEISEGIADGRLRNADFENLATVCKYVVPSGYPENPTKNVKLTIGEIKDALLFYASVNEELGEIFTTSSRSLAVVGIAESIANAEVKAEEALSKITGEIHSRHDIGKKEIIQKRIDHMNRLRG
ncbi:MAG: phosphoribosylamine--glycine ligase [Halobacteriota archaeon]|nr:phosphoribosylamine--glycine ligase [Halobacteriota archaeon]